MEFLRAQGNVVVEANRTLEKTGQVLLSRPDWASEAKSLGPFAGVVWAQGVNSSETVVSASKEDILGSFEANVFFIADTLKHLVKEGALLKP